MDNNKLGKLYNTDYSENDLLAIAESFKALTGQEAGRILVNPDYADKLNWLTDFGIEIKPSHFIRIKNVLVYPA
jgi:hypothetical protein